ncbi:zinc finger domain-containing protein [Streptomyces clavifer]|uniref:zinc finger domain-containing protein n=1 Tax=Streptomyces clavifer TaxID=68188 RepID=UPI003F4C670D
MYGRGKGLAPADRSDADDVEAHACPKCEAQPGSPCRSRGRGGLGDIGRSRRSARPRRVAPADAQGTAVPLPDHRPGDGGLVPRAPLRLRGELRAVESVKCPASMILPLSKYLDH